MFYTQSSFACWYNNSRVLSSSFYGVYCDQDSIVQLFLYLKNVGNRNGYFSTGGCFMAVTGLCGKGRSYLYFTGNNKTEITNHVI